MNPIARLRSIRRRLRASLATVDKTGAVTEQLLERTGELVSELATCRGEIAELAATVNQLGTRMLAEHTRVIDALRVVRDNDAVARERLWELRRTTGYLRAFEENRPLVSVIIPTYTNWPLLRDRALPSVLAQSYENFECIVVGDAAPAEAEAVVAGFDDERLRFINLPYRGPYPDEPEDAWLVLGTAPFNAGLAAARGLWIAGVGDDDALVPDHLASLLQVARSERAEVAYGHLCMVYPDGRRGLMGRSFPPKLTEWGLQATMWHAGLSYITLDPTDWHFGVPNDWSWADRLLRIGVRFAMLDQVVVDYYPSKLWRDAADPRTEPA